MGFRNNVVNAYADWCSFKGFTYARRKYRKEEKLPFIPTEKDIDSLIAGSGPKIAVFLQLLKESGFRPSEAKGLTLEDFDLSQQVCYLNRPCKGSMPRKFKMSNKLTAMITRINSINRIPKSPIWTGSIEHLRRNYEIKRIELSHKLENPNLLRISFRTFRHWKATTEYHRTKDILHVKRLLGHRRIENTLIYTHLIDDDCDDNYVVKVAKDITECVQLLEQGFEYVTEMDGIKLFKKRK